jgi:hypothetical protein
MLFLPKFAEQREEDIGPYDIAEWNLDCAAGLPDTEKFDRKECIKRLDQAAHDAAIYTERSLPEFHKAPEVYDGSENKFRVICMIRWLLKRCGIRYNPAKVPDDALFTMEDRFIHGALLGDGGTCSSLPIVYVAVGRRLGYPLKLVRCLNHQFFRWDDPQERFNIEVNAQGIGDHPDDNYRQGRYQCSPEIEKARGFLLSHTPRMEVASFLEARACCWGLRKNWKRAAEAILWASVMVPSDVWYPHNAKIALEQWRKQLMETEPPGFPEIKVGIPNKNRRFPAPVPRVVEQYFLVYEAKERLFQVPKIQELCAWLWRTKGKGPSWMPKTIEVLLPEHLWSF